MMAARDIIGVVLCAIGISVFGVGYKVLGGMWIWFGAGGLALGSLVLAFSVRAHLIERRLRDYSGPGDGGQRGYSGGSSAADGFDGGGGDGGGGSD
jgi:hypothetical protein